MPGKDRPRGNNNPGIESPGLKDPQESRFISIPIGSGPDGDDEDEDEGDAAGPQDQVVERWLNGAVRTRT